MSARALAGSRKGHKSSTGRVTPSKLRRTAVVAVDGVLAVGTGALVGALRRRRRLSRSDAGLDGPADPGPHRFGRARHQSRRGDPDRSVRDRRFLCGRRRLLGRRVQQPRALDRAQRRDVVLRRGAAAVGREGQPGPGLLRHRLRFEWFVLRRGRLQEQQRRIRAARQRPHRDVLRWRVERDRGACSFQRRWRDELAHLAQVGVVPRPGQLRGGRVLRDGPLNCRRPHRDALGRAVDRHGGPTGVRRQHE